MKFPHHIPVSKVQFESVVGHTVSDCQFYGLRSDDNSLSTEQNFGLHHVITRKSFHPKVRLSFGDYEY